jgi:large subunit ribosomal protein L25
MNQSIHVSDLPHSGSIKFLTDEGLTVAHVAAIREEVVEPEAVDATATPTEPEVAKKGKGETEAAPAADAKTDAKADAKSDKGKK